MAFPSNQFRGQEPGTNEEIKAFAEGVYGVKFPLFERSDFNGPGSSEVAKFLRLNTPEFKAEKGTYTVPWNFAKWIINDKGQVVSFTKPPINPKKLEK